MLSPLRASDSHTLHRILTFEEIINGDSTEELFLVENVYDSEQRNRFGMLGHVLQEAPLTNRSISPFTQTCCILVIIYMLFAEFSLNLFHFEIDKLSETIQIRSHIKAHSL